MTVTKSVTRQLQDGYTIPVPPITKTFKGRTNSCQHSSINASNLRAFFPVIYSFIHKLENYTIIINNI